jgi:hypothetical protein
MFGCNIKSRYEFEADDNETGKVIVSLDIGTTSGRSFVFNQRFEVIGKARFMVF